MKKLDFNKLRQYLPFAFMLIALLCSTMAIADVGNQNRFLGGDSGFDGAGASHLAHAGGQRRFAPWPPWDFT